MSAAALTIAQEPVMGQLTYFTAQKIRRNFSGPLYCIEISMYRLAVSSLMKIRVQKHASLPLMEAFPRAFMLNM